jgi:hypothetical protein
MIKNHFITTYSTQKDIEALNTNFSLFYDEIKGVKNLQTAIQNFFPYGTEFDNVSETHDFVKKDLIQNTDKTYYFSIDFWKKIKTLKYHEGLRYNDIFPITLYNTQINMGTAIYLEDESYIRIIKNDTSLTDDKIQEKLSEVNFGRSFFYLTMPNLNGYFWNVGKTDGNKYYYIAKRAISDFIPLITVFKAPIGETEWNFLEPINGHIITTKRDDVETYFFLQGIDGSSILNDEEVGNSWPFPWKLYINKRAIKDSNGHQMGPLDDHYGVKFYIVEKDKEVIKNYSPIEVDFSVSNGRFHCEADASYLDCIIISFDDYTMQSLKWLRDNCAVMIY